MLVTACAQPRTLLPEISTADIEAEKAYQEKYLYENDFSHIYDRLPTKTKLDQRLSRIAKRVGPAAIKLCNTLRKQETIEKDQRCLFHVELGASKDDSINAYADGHKLVISRRLMQLVKRDDQLGFIIAHEFAHSIMGHLDDQETNIMGGTILGSILDAATAGAGINTSGGFGQIGAEMSLLSFSANYENEADYVGLYILNRAGYKIGQAGEVWRLMSAVNPDAIYTETTHPTSPERFVMMKKTVDEIEQRRKRGEALLPRMKNDKGSDNS
ncbi:MAG: M48 family metallopeptidase [Rickettsiales bacterium]|nr:M48 family metallopeptidase [Rickettsiales bacterium]